MLTYSHTALFTLDASAVNFRPVAGKLAVQVPLIQVPQMLLVLTKRITIDQTAAVVHVSAGHVEQSTHANINMCHFCMH